MRPLTSFTFHIDTPKTGDGVLYLVLASETVSIMLYGFIFSGPRPTSYSYAAYLGALIYTARHTTFQAVRRWIPTVSVAVAAPLILYAANGTTVAAATQPEKFAMWALYEELFFRVVLINVIYRTATRKTSHPKAAAAAVIISGLLFVAQPGHIAQTGWGPEAAIFFAAHLAFLVPTMINGAFIVSAAVHASHNLIVFAHVTGIDTVFSRTATLAVYATMFANAFHLLHRPTRKETPCQTRPTDA